MNSEQQKETLRRQGEARVSPKATARIDGAYLKSLMKDGEKTLSFAKRCSISISKMYEILEIDEEGIFQNPVTDPTLLRKLSSRLAVPVNHLVYYEANTFPIDVDFYERLRFGWFIDNHRDLVDKHKVEDESVVWLREDITLKHSQSDTKTQGRLSFRGTSTNCLNFTFALWAERLTQHLFVVRSVGQEEGKESTRCWVGLFHR